MADTEALYYTSWQQLAQMVEKKIASPAISPTNLSATFITFINRFII